MVAKRKGLTISFMILVLMILAASPVFATDPPGSLSGATAPELKVTSYSITGNGNPIYTNNVVNLDINVFDERIVSSSSPAYEVKPVVSLNTESFTLSAAGDCSVPTITPTGARYTISFTGLKYTGKGKTFSCWVSYLDTKGAPATPVNVPLPMEEVTITLDQCVIYSPPEPTLPPPEIEIKGTGFVLKEAYYGDGEPVYAGKAFTLSAVILATNGTSAVENVSVSFSPPEQLTFADGSSVVYIGTMAPGASVPVDITLLPNANIQEGSYTIGIDVNGVNQQTGLAVMTNMTITMPILQPERFEIFNTYLPSDLMAGIDSGMGYGSVVMVNQGRGAVSNVSFEITGDGLHLEDGRMYIGNVNGGEQRSADFNLLADTPGMIDALVLITYENVRGEIRTLEHPFTISVMDMGEGGFEDPYWPGGDPGFPDPGYEEGRSGPQNWLWVLIVAAVAAGAIIFLVRRQKKKRQEKEAALDYDDDEEE